MQYVDVVIPKFLAKVGNPKTEDLHQAEVEAALRANLIKFNQEKMDGMFAEADFDNAGFLSKPRLIAAATGRYTKRKYGMGDWIVLIAEVMDVPVNKLDSSVDMSVYLLPEQNAAKSAPADDNFPGPAEDSRGPYRRAAQAPAPSGQPTSRSLGGLSIVPSGRSTNKTGSRPSSGVPAALNSQQSVLGASASIKESEHAGSTAPPVSTRQAARTFAFGTTGRLEGADMNTSLSSQYQEYLDAVDLSYGGDELTHWTNRNQLDPPKATAADFARMTFQLSDSYPFETSKPPSSLAKTRQSLASFRPSSKPGFQLHHRTLSPHDLDLKECLGESIYPDPMGQIEPLRASVTNTGLPQQNYVSIGSMVPPPKTFGCRSWWN